MLLEVIIEMFGKLWVDKAVKLLLFFKIINILVLIDKLVRICLNFFVFGVLKFKFFIVIKLFLVILFDNIDFIVKWWIFLGSL